MSRRNCMYCGRFLRASKRKYCGFDCGEKLRNKTGRPGSEAHNAVWRAVRRGDLPKLDGGVACVDCGNPAKNYDHRDYTKPLEVEPVCVRCNKLRGPAKTPRRQDLRPEWFS